jgi:hypothetical protein
VPPPFMRPSPSKLDGLGFDQYDPSVALVRAGVEPRLSRADSLNVGRGRRPLRLTRFLLRSSRLRGRRAPGAMDSAISLPRPTISSK